MKFGKIIRKPVKLLRKKLRTAIAKEGYLSKEDLYKDADATSIASEEESESLMLQEEEKMEVFIDYGYGNTIPTPSRGIACSERAVRKPRRSSLKSSGSTLRRRSSISYRGEVDFILPNGEEGKRRTSISFEEDENQTKEVNSILNMVDSPNQIWFQKEEYASIKQEIVRILKNNLQNEEISSSEVPEEAFLSSSSDTSSSCASELPSSSSDLECTRGLEPIMCESLQEAREQANTSVLEEYSMQRNRGEYNGDTLRQIYSFYTIDSQVEAAYRADLDQQEVQNYLEDTKNMWRRSMR